jgi:hypothetical protein
MSGMGTVRTLSPLVPLAELERRARTWLARDGTVAFSAATADRRQVAHLRRLYRALTGPDGIAGAWMSLAEHGDSTTLHMWRGDVTHPSWRGEPHTG